MKAMLSAASMLGMGLGSLSNIGSMLHPWAPARGVRIRSRVRGKRGPSGAKLWRKAGEGKLGVRW